MNVENTCNNCPANEEYNSLARGCQKCPPGRFKNVLNNSQPCEVCPAGRFANVSGLASCYQCPVGRSRSDSDSALLCTDCAPGTFANATGLTKCFQCPSGRFAATLGEGLLRPNETLPCQACQAGTAAPNLGSTLCDSCPAGKFQVLPGQAFCSPCAPGYFAQSQRSPTCTKCPRGRTQSLEGQQQCESCSSGRYMNDEASSLLECTKCAPGTEAPNAAQSVCTVCENGTFAAEAGMARCSKCASGRFQPLEGKTFCNLCPPGTAQSVSGSLTCTMCNGNNFAEDWEAQSCSVCSGENRTWLSTRVVGALGNTNCTQCFSGTNCSADASQPMRIAARGWYYNKSKHGLQLTVDDIYDLQLAVGKGPFLYECPVQDACSFIDRGGDSISAENWAGVPRLSASPSPSAAAATPSPSPSPGTLTGSASARRTFPSGRFAEAAVGAQMSRALAPRTEERFLPGGSGRAQRFWRWAFGLATGHWIDEDESSACSPELDLANVRLTAASSRLAAALVSHASSRSGSQSTTTARTRTRQLVAIAPQPGQGGHPTSPRHHMASRRDDDTPPSIDSRMLLMSTLRLATSRCEARLLELGWPEGLLLAPDEPRFHTTASTTVATSQVRNLSAAGRNSSLATPSAASRRCVAAAELRAELGLLPAEWVPMKSTGETLRRRALAAAASVLVAGTVPVDQARPMANQTDAVLLADKNLIAIPADGLDLKCRQFHEGPVCGRCTSGAFMGTDRTCRACTDGGSLIQVLSLIGLGVLAAAAIGFCSHDCGSPAPYQTWTTAFGRQIYNFLFIGAVVGSLELTQDAKVALRCWDPLFGGTLDAQSQAFCSELFVTAQDLESAGSNATVTALTAAPTESFQDPFWLFVINAPSAATTVGLDLLSQSFSCATSLRYDQGSIVWFLVPPLLLVGMVLASLLWHGAHSVVHAVAYLVHSTLCGASRRQPALDPCGRCVRACRPYRVEAALFGIAKGDEALTRIKREFPDFDEDAPFACASKCCSRGLTVSSPSGRVLAGFLVAWYIVFTPLTAHVVNLGITSRQIDGSTFLANDFSVILSEEGRLQPEFVSRLIFGVTSGALFLVLFPVFVLQTLAKNDENLLDRGFGRSWSFVYDGYRLGLQNAGMDKQILTTSVAIAADMISRLQVADLERKGLNEAEKLAEDTICFPVSTPCDNSDCYRTNVRQLSCWRPFRNFFTIRCVAGLCCCCCTCCFDMGRVCENTICRLVGIGRSTDDASPEAGARRKQLERYRRMRLAGLAVVKHLELLEQYDVDAAQAVTWGISRNTSMRVSAIRAMLARQPLPTDPRCQQPNMHAGEAEVERMERDGPAAAEEGGVFSERLPRGERMKVQAGARRVLEARFAGIPPEPDRRSSVWLPHLKQPVLRLAEKIAAVVEEGLDDEASAAAGQRSRRGARVGGGSTTGHPPTIVPGSKEADLSMLRLHRVRRAAETTFAANESQSKALQTYLSSMDAALALQAKETGERMLAEGSGTSSLASLETPAEIETRLANSRLRAKRTFTDFVESQARKSFATWEVQLLLRRAVFICVELLASTAVDVKAFVVGIVTLIFLILHVRTLPFESADLNITETLTLLAALARQLAVLASLMVEILETQAAITGDAVLLLGFKAQTAIAGLALITSVLTLLNICCLLFFFFGHALAMAVGVCIPKPSQVTPAPKASSFSGQALPDDTVLRAERPILDFVNVLCSRRLPEPCYCLCPCCWRCFDSHREHGSTSELGRPVLHQHDFVPPHRVRMAMVLRYLNPVVRTDGDARHREDMLKVRARLRRYLSHIYRPEEPRESEETAMYQDLDATILGKEEQANRTAETARIFKFLVRATDSSVDPAVAALVVDMAGGEGSLSTADLRKQARSAVESLQKAMARRQSLNVSLMSSSLLEQRRQKQQREQTEAAFRDALASIDTSHATEAWGDLLVAGKMELMWSQPTEVHELLQPHSAKTSRSKLKAALGVASKLLAQAKQMPQADPSRLDQLLAKWEQQLLRSAKLWARKNTMGSMFPELDEQEEVELRTALAADSPSTPSRDAAAGKEVEPTARVAGANRAAAAAPARAPKTDVAPEFDVEARLRAIAQGTGLDTAATQGMSTTEQLARVRQKLKGVSRGRSRLARGHFEEVADDDAMDDEPASSDDSS